VQPCCKKFLTPPYCLKYAIGQLRLVDVLGKEIRQKWYVGHS
jgi:hypothetical protein